MSTTFATSAAVEHAVTHKPPQAKPHGVPGQFATLMWQQANEESASGMTDTTARPPPDDANTEHSKADEHPFVDTAQQALQALLDWRGLLPGSQTPQTSIANLGNPTDGSNLQRSGISLTNATTALANESAPKAPLAFALDGPPSADNAATWTAPSPSDTELAAALAKAAEPSPATPPQTQPLPIAAHTSGADTRAQVPGKLRPGSTKTTPLGPVRTGVVTAAETSTAAQTPLRPSQIAETTGSARSTLDLASRSDAMESTAPNATDQNGALEPTAVTGLQGPDTHPGKDIQPCDIPPAPPTSPDTTPAPEAFADMFQQHMDDLGAQISYWTAQGSQRASFTIGSAEDGPLEVTLSFTDGKLAVAFETDRESVREVLQNGAQEALQRLMDAQGIALGNVSVGGNRTNTPQDSPAEHPTVDLVQRRRSLKATATDVSAPATHRPPPIMTATKLDFYA